LYERTARLELFEHVFLASNRATTLDEVMRIAVDAICAHTGWPVGHVYLRSEAAEAEVVATPIWHLDEPARFEALRVLTEETSFASGAGLPGRVLAEAKPVWIVDVTRDASFLRAQKTRDLGVKAAFAFPILVAGEVAAVLEFFSPAPAEPVHGLLGLMEEIGTLLGRVLERTRAEQERERLTERMEVLLNSAGEGIFGIDAEGVTVFVNPAAAAMLGCTAGELIGRQLHAVVHGDLSHGHADCPLYAPILSGREPEPQSDVFCREDGSTFPVEFVSRRLTERGGISGAVITLRDITERVRFEAQLRHLADHDALTGLFNRRRFEEELDESIALARRNSESGAVLMLDLDALKSVNDAFGHFAGDQLIQATASRLRARMRKTDVLTRLGGDEFAVILPGTSAESAEKFAHGLVELIGSRDLAVGRHRMRTTVSVGVATFGAEEITSEELLDRADAALYSAKEAGGSGFTVYRPDQTDRARAARSWAQRIRDALVADRFVLHGQPTLPLASGRSELIELLVRMREDSGELIYPGAFLPAAERFDLVQEIDRWVATAAIGFLAELQSEGHRDVRVAINLSAKSLDRGELPEFIRDQLEATKVSPSSLIFEITETAAISDIEAAREFATRLTSIGCHFALDDFGAGFGSFNYLKHLPLSYLKIDGEFVANLRTSRSDQRIVRAIADVGRGLGLQTVAEFVGDAETLEFLRSCDVDYAQGFYVSRPLPLTEISLPGR
jgi:diguanylate cyclase (GGDEF)-like protein/PAS domain S-box-containing protein